MFTHEIIKYKPPEVVIPPVRQQQHQLTHTPLSQSELKASNYMDKIAYAKWVEGPNCKGKFQKGDIVCHSYWSCIPNHAPIEYYKITDIQELYWLCSYDFTLKEPRAIGALSKDGILFWYAPGQLRKLNEQEVALVNLRNPSKQNDDPNIVTSSN